MTDARSRTPQEYMRSTWRRWGRGRRLLVAVIGALVVLAVGAISAAALVGLPTILTGDSNAASPTGSGDAGGSQAIPNAQNFAALAPGEATLSAVGQGAGPVEGESFTHPTGTEVVLGNQYSGGKALKITSGQALPTKRVTITEASHVLVRARAGQSGGSPTLTIRVDGNNAGTRRITSDVLSDYLYAGITLQPGTYTLGLKGGDLAQGRYVFVDVLRFPAVNEPPVANNDPTSAGDPNYTTLEDAPLTVSAANGVLANDSDPDPGDAITAEKVSGPSHGTLALNPDGSFSYTPNADFNGNDSFTYKAKDSHGSLSTAATVTITVSPVNDVPTDVSLSPSGVEENRVAGTAVGTLSTEDVDAGDTHTYTLVSGAGDDDNGSFKFFGSTLHTDAVFDFETKDTYTVRVKTDDGQGGTFEEQLTISIIDANDDPTDITLSNNAVDENQPSGTEVGTLTSTDQDAGDSFTYTLVSGTGDTDNASFQISGDKLQTAGPLNFEDGATRSVRVRTSDGHGSTFEEQFTITINDLNDAPTNLALSNNAVDENQPSGTTVGSFSADEEDGDALGFAFATGSGDADNGSFTITGGTLKTNSQFDFEAKDSYTIRVKADDGQGGTVEKQFTITVTNANDNPTDIALSNNTVDENQPSGTAVGTLSTTDQDSGDTHTYTLVSGAGDTDNASFQISGSTLQTNEKFDSEIKDSYTIRLRTDDGHGGTFEKVLTVSVTDANDAPTDIALSNASLAENQPSGTAVGTLSTTDQDSGDTHTYSLIAGNGDTDNAQFQISGGTLQTKATFDFEAKDSYTVRVKADDGHGGTFEKQFTVTVTNANDNPTDVAMSNSSVAENQPSGTAVGTLSTTDQDTSDTHTYTLVSGAGDADNGQFTISGSELHTNAQFDFEAKDNYTVRVKADDGHGGTFEKQFTVTVTNANDNPTDISLSKSTVVEHEPSGTAVGTLSTTDQEAADTHTYALVAGTGDTDNASFQVSGSELQTKADLVVGTYSIRVRTDDGHPGGTFEKQFEITVVPANFAPTDISLSNNNVAENQPSGTDVGTLTTTDQDAADTHTYSLVAGSGDTDNASFTITGDTLKTGAQFDFETKNSYTIRVQTDDGHAGGTFEESFTITVTNVNDAPTDIALSNSSVTENQPSGTDVGTLSTTDQDAADTHTYTLVSGTGDTDNGQFQISGSTLKTNAQFNFEAKNSYSIRVQSDDGQGGTTSKQFTITITDVNEAPTNLALSNSSVAENQPSGTNVGTLSTTDEDSANTHTYSLVAGTGDTDNASFQISGSTLQTKAAFDFETKSSYMIRLQTSDGHGGTFEKQFTVSVTNANDAPTDIALSKSDVDENLPSATPVGTFSTTDQDTADTHTYSLVTGTGSTDNASFQIVNGELRTGASFNFEAKNSYSIRVRTTDNGTPAQFFEESFTISVNDVNDAPVAGTDSYSGAIGNTKASLGVTVTGEPVVALTGNVLTFNDTDEDATFPHTLSAVQETVTSTGGGLATISSDGSFTFVPGVGDKNQSDTFTYKVTDGQATSSGTVTVGIANSIVWYVDNAKANGDGRSNSPFNTLTGVNGAGGSGDADGTGDYIFLFQGSGNYTGGLPLEASQKLIGQAANLTVGSSTLLAGDPAKRPTLTNTNADVIDLDDANEVRGLGVDPQGTGGGIAGSTGDTGGATIDDVRVIDSGTLGTQPGLELDATTGTFNISNLTVSTVGATGVRLNNAGTTNFASTGTISITTSGAKALDATGALATPTNMGTGSVFDDITVTGSGAGGVSMSGTTGTTTFGDGTATDLSLTTTSGATPAFGLSNAGTVSVPSGGTANVSATGGPAVDIGGTSTNATGFNFDDVDSASSANDGINLDGLGTGTFSATSGDISGAADIAFDLNGGSGNVTYPGNLGNGTGQSAEITGRSGGAVTLSGQIADTNDAGGGISMSTNTGGSTTFSATSKVLNTGSSPAFSSTGSGHTIDFTNGGLDIDATSGAGFSATGGGTVTVGTGTNPNTIDTTTGTALNVANTPIGAGGLTFRSISSNGATNGIVLNSTGNQGGLTVTGNTSGLCGGDVKPSVVAAASADCSGGHIQNTVGADGTTGGTGIYLNDTRSVSLTRVWLSGNANYGIRGTNVNGFTFSNSLIDGTNGTSVGAENEGGIYFTGLTGSASVANSSISGASLNNVTVLNTSGTLDRLNFNEVQIGANSNLGGDGMLIQPDGSATIKATVEDSRFTSARGDLFQMSLRTGGANDLVFQRNALSNNHPNIVSGGGGFTITSSGDATSLTYNISDNTFRDSVGANLVIGMDGKSGTFTGTINNNTIGVQGATQAGSTQGGGIVIGGFLQGTSTHTVAVTNNRVYDYSNNGILMVAGEATVLASPTGRLNATIQGNTVAEPSPSAQLGAFNGIRMVMGTSSQASLGVPHAYKGCFTIGSATAALKNTVSGSSTGGASEIRLFPRFNAQVGVIGFTPTGNTASDGAAMSQFLRANNTTSAGAVGADGSNSSTNPYLGTCPP